MGLAIRLELTRKIIHLSSIWIPICYYLLDFFTMLAVLLVTTVVVISMDLLRKQPTPKGALVRGLCRALFLDEILRLHEKAGALSGASYMLISALICLIILPKEIFITAFSVLILADTSAALMGMSFGKTKLLGSKTIVGTSTFFLVSSTIAVLFAIQFGLNLKHAIFAAGIATIAEALSNKVGIDDNLLIPVAYGVAFMSIVKLYG